MQEIYEKVLKNYPELKQELEARISIEKAENTLNIFIEYYDKMSILDVLLMGALAYIVSESAKAITKLKDEEKNGIEIIEAYEIIGNILKDASEQCINKSKE